MTLKRLRAEIIAIERAFPELALPQGRRAIRRSLRSATTRTRTMSAAARKAVSARMKRDRERNGGRLARRSSECCAVRSDRQIAPSRHQEDSMLGSVVISAV